MHSLAFYGEAIPGERVPDLMNFVRTGAFEPLLSWSFDRNTGDLVQSNNGVDTTLLGGVSWSSDGPELTCRDRGESRAPVIVNPDFQYARVAQEVSLQLQGSDPDNDVLTYVARFKPAGRTPFLDGLPPGLTLDSATGLISGSPTVPGIYDIVLGLEDGFGNVDSETFGWSVLGEEDLFFEQHFSGGGPFTREDAQCAQWVNFIDSIDSDVTYSRVSIDSTANGGFGPESCESPETANAICQSLRRCAQTGAEQCTVPSQEFSCATTRQGASPNTRGSFWFAGGAAGEMELSWNTDINECHPGVGQVKYTVRPCDVRTNAFWGGYMSTCRNPHIPQTLRVVCHVD